MQYRVEAFKCKVNGVIELQDDIIPVGSFYEGGELFIICLDPLEVKKLPGEDDDEKEKVEKEKTSEEEEAGEKLGAH